MPSHTIPETLRADLTDLTDRADRADRATPAVRAADIVDLPEPDGYYDLPVVKAAPWRWYVPAYFYCGGLAGAASSLAGTAELLAAHLPLERQLRWIALGGEAAGAALLIADLGRPARFHHMMRVFRPTSPMNVGTWILSSASATTALGLAWALRRRRAPAALSVSSIVTGAMLSTYTGVLLGNTAIPIWRATRRHLPIWFAALSAASAGAMLELVAPDLRGARAYAIAGKAAQLITAGTVARAARTAGVAAPLATGRAAAWWRVSAWLGAAGLAASLLARRRPILAGALTTASVLLGRFAIAEAGVASAADPRASLAPRVR